MIDNIHDHTSPHHAPLDGEEDTGLYINDPAEESAYGDGEMAKRPNGEAIVTAAEVREWLEERAELARQLANLDKRIDAARMLFGDRMPQIGPESHDESNENMAGAVIKISKTYPAGMKYSQLQDELRKNPVFAARLNRTQNYFYTMISRLVDRGDLRRDGKLLLPGERVSAE